VIIGDRGKIGADLAFLGQAVSAAPPAGATAVPSAVPPPTPDQIDEREFGTGPMLELARLARAGDPAGLERAVLALRGKAPLVESDPRAPGRSVVTFLHLADPDVHLVTLPQFRSGSVPVAQDANSPRPPARSLPAAFRRLWGSRLWYLRLNLPDTTLLGYTIGVERLPRPGADPREARSDEMLDPLNPERLGTRGDVSILRLPNAPAQRWIAERPEVPRGRLEPGTLQSQALGATRAVTVYLPPGYDSLREPAHLVFVFDGDWFSKDLRAPTVLDNLHHEQRVPPTVAVFVDAGDTRDRDLVNYEPFAEFLANELLPWVAGRYRVSRAPGHVALSGASFGGLAAAFIALRHPDRFGNVLSQSGAFWPPSGWNPMTPYGPGADGDSALVEAYVRAPRADVHFYLDTGLCEERMLASNRRLRDVLLAKGYRLTYVEHPGTHNGVYWRNSLGDGLIVLFGGREAAP
jgi:enterochelin esterase family protein